MTNMSYCRFQNTLGDLRDCKHTLDELNETRNMGEEAIKEERLDSFAQLSSDEAAAAANLIELAREIVEEFGEDQEFLGEIDKAHKADR